MSSPVEEMLKSIVEEFAVAGVRKEDLEQKTLFRLLNCCLPDTCQTENQRPAAEVVQRE